MLRAGQVSHHLNPPNSSPTTPRNGRKSAFPAQAEQEKGFTAPQSRGQNQVLPMPFPSWEKGKPNLDALHPTPRRNLPPPPRKHLVLETLQSLLLFLFYFTLFWRSHSFRRTISSPVGIFNEHFAIVAVKCQGSRRGRSPPPYPSHLRCWSQIFPFPPQNKRGFGFCSVPRMDEPTLSDGHAWAVGNRDTAPQAAQSF